MSKVKCGLVDEGVSPYLRRPLRSLAGVLASRKAAEDTATGTGRDLHPAEARPAPIDSARARIVMD